MEKKFDTSLTIQKSFEFMRSMHLTEGVKPISVRLARDNMREITLLPLSPFDKDSPEVLNIDFNEDDVEDLDRKKIVHNGRHTYAISPLDSSLKFSTGFFNCIGLVIAGMDKNTNENISFFVHKGTTVPVEEENEENFIRHLESRLNEIKEQCKPGTIDAVIFGGNYSKVLNQAKVSYKQAYLKNVKLLTSKIKKILKFKPFIENGPHPTEAGPDNAYYNTANRTLFLIRGQINSDIGSFTESDILS